MRIRLIACGIALLWAPAALRAQPTYKLGVGGHVHPQAVLKLEGGKVSRSVVKDDPGFRLLFSFFKDGKSIETLDARALETVDLPNKGAGTYAVVLEVFFPSYRGGNDQKGQFKAISNYLTYKYTPGAKPVVEVLPQTPALVVHCGKGAGKNQDVKLEKGYAYKLVQGVPIDTWPAPQTHAWSDPKLVRCEIVVPAETPGVLRLLVLDGDKQGRKLLASVQGRNLPEVEAAVAPGKVLELPLSAAETKTGKIEVAVQNQLATGTAVLSTVEFVPAFPR